LALRKQQISTEIVTQSHGQCLHKNCPFEVLTFTCTVHNAR